MRIPSTLTCLILFALFILLPSPPSLIGAQPPNVSSRIAASGGPQSLLESSVIRGGSLIVVVPASRDAVLAYSFGTGKWHRQMISPTEKASINPVASTNVAAVRVDNQVFGFSAMKGNWDSVKVSPNPKAWPTVDGDVLTFLDGSKFYVFSARSGKWDGIDLETGKSIK